MLTALAGVPSLWPRGARVVTVGDYPRGDEVAAGRPFVGRVGSVVTRLLTAGGLDPEHVAMTHVVRHPPVGGYDEKHFLALDADELLRWREALVRDLSSRKFLVALTFGRESLEALTGQRDLESYSGSLLPCPQIPGLWVLPLIHPERIVAGGRWIELFVSSHLVRSKVGPLLDGLWTGYVPWHENLAPQIDEVERWIGFALASPETHVSLDIETRGGSIACVGLGRATPEGDTAICVPIQTTRGPWFSVTEEATWWRLLQRLAERKTLVGHNMVFDIDWLYDYGINPASIDDTMLAFHRQHPELPKSLDFVSMWYTDIPYYKSDGKTWGFAQPDERLWSYNLKDVVATLRCWRALANLENRSAQTYREYTKPTWPIAFEMQLRGLPVDPAGIDVARVVATEELARLYPKLAELSAGELVVKPKNKKITDAQFKSFLYGTLGLKPKINRKTKAVTADEDAIIELLIENPGLEVLKAIAAERKFTKALNSYININWGPVLPVEA